MGLKETLEEYVEEKKSTLENVEIAMLSADFAALIALILNH